jgi:hypothetical protein
VESTVTAVVLTQAQEGNSGLVRQLGQFQELLQPLMGREGLPRIDVAAELAEGEDAEIHRSLPVAPMNPDS